MLSPAFYGADAPCILLYVSKITAAALNSTVCTIKIFRSGAPRVFLCGGYPSPRLSAPMLVCADFFLCFSSYGALPHTPRGLRPSTPQPFEKRLAKTLPCVCFALIFSFVPLFVFFAFVVCFVFILLIFSFAYANSCAYSNRGDRT